jgi:hypothetical protein
MSTSQHIHELALSFATQKVAADKRPVVNSPAFNVEITDFYSTYLSAVKIITALSTDESFRDTIKNPPPYKPAKGRVV